MGTQFWWFFDAAAAALLLVTIFLSGKKGFSKTIVVMIGYVVAVIAGLSASGSVAGFVYNNSVKQSNVKNITSVLEKTDFTQKTKIYIESLGYSVSVNENTLSEVLSSEEDIYDELYKYVNNINGRTVDTKEEFTEKMTEGFAEITETMLEGELTTYEAVAAGNAIRSGKTDFSETVSLIYSGNTKEAAEHIEKNYIAQSSADIIGIFCFIIIVFVVMIIVRIAAAKINEKEAVRPLGDISEHVAGGVIGAAEGIVLLFVAAAAVRACVILGNNEMLLFNSDSIDKTIFFRHIYNIMLKL